MGHGKLEGSMETRGQRRQGDKGDSEDKENNQCPMPHALHFI
ncbi:MAG: hypothetical protein V7K95_04285 [Nostoc sp.]